MIQGMNAELVSISLNVRAYGSAWNCFHIASTDKADGSSQVRRMKISKQFRWMLARPKRFELLTPRFVVWCSIQLSYGRANRPYR